MSSFFTLMLSPLEVVSILLLGVMVITWLISIFQKNAGVIDIACALSVGLIAFLAFLMGDGDFVRRTLFFTIVVLWTVRLTLRLFTNYNENQEEERYHQMRMEADEKANLKFLFYFLFRGSLLFVSTLFFFPVNFNVSPYLSTFEWGGAVVALAALIFKPSFEWMVWGGLAIFALSTPYGWLGIIGAATTFVNSKQTINTPLPWPKR